MNRFLLLTLVAVLSCPIGWIATVRAADQPNIVMILGDDQAWTDYGFMGHPEIKTPHLDRLASQSACFTQGYVPSSLCRPTIRLNCQKLRSGVRLR